MMFLKEDRKNIGCEKKFLSRMYCEQYAYYAYIILPYNLLIYDIYYSIFHIIIFCFLCKYFGYLIFNWSISYNKQTICTVKINHAKIHWDLMAAGL